MSPRVLVSAVLLAAVAAAPVFAATAPSVGITAPGAGAAALTGADIPVTVNVNNFKLECTDIGHPAKPGQGHIHAMLDGMSMDQMTNLYCSHSFAISGVGVKPGRHELAVVLAADDHVNIGKPAMVRFDYAPASAQTLPAAKVVGAASVKILSPAPGAAVGRKFDLKVAVSGFDLSCDLEGKPNVAGYGQHVFVNQAGAAPPMMQHDMKSGTENQKGNAMGMESMAMPGMIGMPCTTTIPVDLTAWKSGKTHLLVMLANNDHKPADGAVPAGVDLTLK